MSHRFHKGFSTVELLVVLALGSVILGGVMVTYGTLVSGRGKISESMTLTLPGTLSTNFFGDPAGPRVVPAAPNYGVLAKAEMLREEFQSDVMTATGVFCLYRRASVIANPIRQTWYPFDPLVDGPIESPMDFYQHLVKVIPMAATVFEPPSNPGSNNLAAAPHATIFLTGFSSEAGRLPIIAIYEIDVLAFRTARPWGFHGSVRRYGHPAGILDGAAPVSCVLAGSYEVFYPPSVPNPRSPSQFSNDGFSPLFITFERSLRRSVVEDNVMGRDRFKVAAERPFYFIWWPDPTVATLADNSLNSRPPREPRRAYNHMGGRTAYMFTVPMFPAL